MAELKKEKSDAELLAELGYDIPITKKATYTPREERIIAGFEEIQDFVQKHGRLPQHGEGNDIFERLYAVRLDRIRALDECRALLINMDHQGLLGVACEASELNKEYQTDAEMLAVLGVDVEPENSLTVLKHVKSKAEKKAAEEFASRTRCADFDLFKPMFTQVQKELENGFRITKLLKQQPPIEEGDLFILQGQKVYVQSVGDEFFNESGHKDARLRVIFDNGTESNLLLRSLQKALKKDEAARRIIEIEQGPLFSSEAEHSDTASGTIYVLRSQSDHPAVAENRSLIHKIGVTGGHVNTRIADAKNDPTYLMADVEIVATYQLYNINRAKLEGILHRVFSPAKLDIQIHDRFGKAVVPREWFLVPLFVIDEVVEKIKEGTIGEYSYDRASATLVKN